MTVASPARKLSPSEANSGAAHDASKQSFDLYEQLLHPKFLKVFPCVLGILIGFAACCISGAQVAKTNFYENFHRFTDYTNPTTLYYPTIAQMLAIVNAQSTTEQTVVIIGGNSIFNGIGQRSNEIWTDDLRKTLGRDFAVFNFANCGSQSFEGAYWVAESLLARGRKVLYVTVAIPTAGGAPEGSKVYGYLFWDAHEKKLLAQSPERDNLINTRLALMDDKEKTRIADLKLRMQMDKVLHFQDLWTSIGYRNAFTVWTQGTAGSPFKARRLYADMQPDPRPSATRFSKSIEFPHELATVSGYCDGFFAIQGDRWQPNDTAWAVLTSQLKGLVPEPFKKNCLVVIAKKSALFSGTNHPAAKRAHSCCDLNERKVVESCRLPCHYCWCRPGRPGFSGLLAFSRRRWKENVCSGRPASAVLK